MGFKVKDAVVEVQDTSGENSNTGAWFAWQFVSEWFR
jgi:hypothetical protein